MCILSQWKRVFTAAFSEMSEMMISTHEKLKPAKENVQQENKTKVSYICVVC
jgi:hypothetical protein